jgi:general secretion pathway protein G
MKTHRSLSSGFTLVELLIVVVIIGILAGIVMLVFGSNTDKAEALRLASELDSMRSAIVMYVNENRRRGFDPLSEADGVIINGANAFLDRSPNANFNIIRSTDGVLIGLNVNNPSAGLTSALNKLVTKSGLYVSVSGGTYTLSMKIK